MAASTNRTVDDVRLPIGWLPADSLSPPWVYNEERELLVEEVLTTFLDANAASQAPLIKVEEDGNEVIIIDDDDNNKNNNNNDDEWDEYDDVDTEVINRGWGYDEDYQYE